MVYGKRISITLYTVITFVVIVLEEEKKNKKKIEKLYLFECFFGTFLSYAEITKITSEKENCFSVFTPLCMHRLFHGRYM